MLSGAAPTRRLPALRRFRPGGASRFSTWLVVVVRRLCLDHHRQRYGRAGDTAEAVPAADRTARRRLVNLEGDTDSLPALPDTGRPTVITEFSQREVSSVLGREMDVLELRDRELLRLRFEDELTGREIAERMGFESTSQVFRRLDTLLGMLRDKLRRAGIESAA